MPGTILENLSGRKLTVLVCALLVCQLICFLIGGLIGKCVCVCVHNLSILLIYVFVIKLCVFHLSILCGCVRIRSTDTSQRTEYIADRMQRCTGII